MTLRELRRIGSIVPGVILAACATDATAPTDGPSVTIAVSLAAAAGGVSDAYARTDAVAVRVTVSGQTVADEVQSWSPGDDGVPVRVRLDRTSAGEPIEVEVTLRANGAGTFGGSGAGTVAEGGPTRVEVDLEPIIAAVAMGDPAARFTAIGETLVLSGAAVFATGDTIPGVEIAWRSLDPDIVDVESDGAALALAEGTARVEATAETVTTPGTARVDPVAVRIEVTPGEATISVGEVRRFEASIVDRNGNVLTRAPIWTTSSMPVATVSPEGDVTGVAAGRATITATSGDVSDNVPVTVVSAPAPPSGLGIGGVNEGQRLVLLQWQDNAPNEDEFRVERQVSEGPWTQIATLPANTTSFEAPGLPGINLFRVFACNDEGCSAPSNETEVEFMSGPPVVETLESPDLGIMAGSVLSGGPYRVYFQYGFYDDTFDPDCSFCFEETEPVIRTESGVFTEAAPYVYVDYPFQYRIVVESEFGTVYGDQRVLPALPVSLGGTLDLNRVDAVLTMYTPPGTDPSPIQSVTFYSYTTGAVVQDGTPTIHDTGFERRFVYDAFWPPFSDPYEIIDADITFRNGVIGVASVCLGDCSSYGERPPGRVPRHRVTRTPTSAREEIR